MILIFLLMFLTVSCGTALKFSAKDILPRKGCVFVTKTVERHKCEKKKCYHKRYVSYGSGFIIETTYKGSYIMTAEHVCRSPKPPKDISQKTKLKIKTLSGRYFDAIVIDVNEKIDACMLFAQDLVTDVEKVEIAQDMPQEGDKVFNIASPYGIHDYNIVPLFEGRYIGQREDEAMYVFPAGPGSSGSMILNEKGELIGLLHSVYRRMNNIVLSVRYDDLKQFIRRNLIENAQERPSRINNYTAGKL